MTVVSLLPIAGGSSNSTDFNDVNFRDYDGTIVNSYSASDFLALSAMPNNPSHDELTSQGWNWLLSDAKAYVTEYGKLEIGQMYITDDGKTRIYIHLDNSDFLSPYLVIAVNGTVVVDWGDGSNMDTMTGTSNTTLKYQQHVYATTGDYTITLNPTSGSFAFYGASDHASVLRTVGAADNRARSQAYSNAITKIEIGSSAYIGNYGFQKISKCKSITIPSSVTSIESNAFYYCYALRSITIPSGVTSITNYTFGYCYTLQSITISSSVTSIAGYAFSYCYTLQSITIPSSVTSIGSYAFYYCYALQSITIPSSVTIIWNYAFGYCYTLQSITIPSDVTSIGNNAFAYCYDMREYHILPTTVPAFGTNVFSGIMSGTVIYVPSGMLNAYQTATNASTYASYMQEEPA